MPGDFVRGLANPAPQPPAIAVLLAGVLALSSCATPQARCKVPLDISSPLYKGTKVVAYAHGTAECPVWVYANGQQVGKSVVSLVGQGEVLLSRALLEGETVTAKQDGQGSPTWPQKSPKVQKIPSQLLSNGEQFQPPSIIPPAVACQKGIRVQGLVEGVRASVTGNPVSPPEERSSGSEWTPYQRAFLRVEPALRKDDSLVSMQDMETAFPQASTYSSPGEAVQGTPDSLPPPVLLEDVGKDGVPDALVGAKALTFCDLFVGAVLTVYAVDQQNHERAVGGGIATDTCNWTGVEPLKKGLKYCARQSLCRTESPKDTGCAFPHDSINVPSIREPLCPGDTEVLVDKTAFGSTVLLRIDGDENRGNATAPGPSTVVNVSGGVPLQENVQVAVKQYNPALDSGWSGDIRVKTSAECEAARRNRDTPPSPPPTAPLPAIQYVSGVCHPGTFNDPTGKPSEQARFVVTSLHPLKTIEVQAHVPTGLSMPDSEDKKFLLSPYQAADFKSIGFDCKSEWKVYGAVFVD